MSLQSAPVEGAEAPSAASSRASKFPQLSVDLPDWLHFEPADKAKAKEYFLSNLPRRIRDPTQPSGWRLAKKGELVDGDTGRSAEMYSVWGSSYKDMGDFGIGLGLYFSQLLGMAAMFIVCGLISIPTIQKNSDFNPDDLSTSLKGSAVGATRDDLDPTQGTTDLLCCAVLLVFCYFAGKAEDSMAEKIDLSQQTAQDYSIVISNPPKDLLDPDTYQKFFSDKFGEVVYVTISLDNGELLKKLAWRRICEKRIAYWRLKIASDEDAFSSETNEASAWGRQLQKIGLSRSLGYWNEQMEATLAAIDRLKSDVYYPKRVYIQFNTEQAQRNCLHQMAVGLLDVKADVKTEYSFRGHTLRVKEPVEPSEVLWKNLHVPESTRLAARAFTLGIAGVVLLISYFVLKSLYGKAGISAVFVSCLNFGLPFFMKRISVAFEPHTDEGNLQQSIMTKLVFARMINTAVLIFAVTPNDEMLSEATMDQVQAILIADCFTTPLLRFLNFNQLLRQNVLARKALTQETMNLYYEGVYWNLAERYTDMTKTLFVSLFYSALLPTGLFVTAFSMISTYWVDKYCLLRVWQRPPMLDGSLATQSRHYIVFAVFMHVVMATYFFAGWPFRTSTRPSCFLTCDETDEMTGTQKDLLGIYNPAVIIVTVLLGVVWFGSELRALVDKYLRGSHDVVGRATNITFRECHPYAYVPQIKHMGLPVSLLAAHMDTLLPENLEFAAGVDPAEFSLISETDLPGMAAEARNRLFGVVKFYPASVASGLYIPGAPQHSGGGLQSAPAGLQSQPVGMPKENAARGVQMTLNSTPVTGGARGPGQGLAVPPVGPAGGGLTSAPVGGGGLTSAPVGGGGLTSAPVGGGGLSSAPVGGGVHPPPAPQQRGGFAPPPGMGGFAPPPSGLGGFQVASGGNAQTGNVPHIPGVQAAPARQVRCPGCQAVLTVQPGMTQFRCSGCGMQCAC